MNAEEDESGSTATVVFIGGDDLFISHIGDSSVVRTMAAFVIIKSFSFHIEWK